MRRRLLILAFISFACWSQPAQQQPQPPIVVQIQTPPANPWMRLVELVIPGVVGAGLALFGVWLTNRYNATNNAANRQHDLEKLNREHSFALKRDVLLRLIQLQVHTVAALKRFQHLKANFETYKAAADDDYRKKQAKKNMLNARAEYWLRRTELDQATAAACLAVPDDLWKSAQAVGASIIETYEQPFNRGSDRTKTVEQVGEELAAFTEAARKELGIVHIDA